MSSEINAVIVPALAAKAAAASGGNALSRAQLTSPPLAWKACFNERAVGLRQII
jgi:hypothetical protein